MYVRTYVRNYTRQQQKARGEVAIKARMYASDMHTYVHIMWKLTYCHYDNNGT